MRHAGCADATGAYPPTYPPTLRAEPLLSFSGWLLCMYTVTLECIPPYPAHRLARAGQAAATWGTVYRVLLALFICSKLERTTLSGRRNFAFR